MATTSADAPVSASTAIHNVATPATARNTNAAFSPPKRLMRRRTVIAIAHRLSTVSNFDRIVVLQGGRVIQDGAPAELTRKPDSRLRALLDTERELRDGLESARSWRRFRLDDGRIGENA